MRIYSLNELSRLTRAELFQLYARIITALPRLPDGSFERHAATGADCRQGFELAVRETSRLVQQPADQRRLAVIDVTDDNNADERTRVGQDHAEGIGNLDIHGGSSFAGKSGWKVGTGDGRRGSWIPKLQIAARTQALECIFRFVVHGAS